MKGLKYFLPVVLWGLILSSGYSKEVKSIMPTKEKIDLTGEWQYQTDTDNIGLQENWQEKTFKDKIRLPGTLNQLFTYVGTAWYKRDIDIPASFIGKHLKLVMERTKVTELWIDRQRIGSNKLLSSAQVYDVTGKLNPGRHVLTLMVDNTHKSVPTGGSHILGYDDQNNFNGILGKFYLEATPLTRIEKVTIYPDIHKKEILVNVEIQNEVVNIGKTSVVMKAHSWNYGNPQQVPELTTPVNLIKGDNNIVIKYALGKSARLWSEFTPALYQLEVKLSGDNGVLDCQSVDFGLREFKTQETQFTINGKKTFLRGKHDGCVFPLTAHTPMELNDWIRYYKILKEYGINHVRFHSWCPPEAAFQAADMEGVYLQPELPYWGSYDEKNTTLINFMRNEGNHILSDYGNHPSFVLITLGNELGGSREVMDDMVLYLKARDNRHLYAIGTNPFYWDPKPGVHDDFFDIAWTKGYQPTRKYHVRSSFATAEDPGSGLINSEYPSTLRNYEGAIEGINMPVIGHEVGQYQVYPDYKEIPEYAGVVKADHLIEYRSRLEKAGMLDQANDFFKSSGQSALIEYKEEIETALRTKGFGGFQLLDLQDYPGQGTALVGMLNAFLKSKGIVAPTEFREFCNRVVPLLVMQKYCWMNKETFHGKIEIANYGPKDIVDKTVSWKLVSTESNVLIGEGSKKIKDIAQGELTEIAEIKIPLGNIKQAQKTILTLTIDGTPYRNHYPVWVYPSDININVPTQIKIVNTLDQPTLDQLNQGGTVLFIPNPEDIKDKSLGPQFINEFWNWLMFKNICEQNNKPVSPGTLGILVNPQHPLFKGFPTESHNDWQWWTICKNSRPFILDMIPKEYRPIVQVIDNIDRNHKLGTVFEFKVGSGKLLVSTVNLSAITDTPEGRQFYSSILQYMTSSQFNPGYKLSVDDLKSMF